MLCEYGCGKEAKYQFKNGKWCCEPHYLKCPESRKNRIGKNNPFYNKTHNAITKNKIRKSMTGEKNHRYGIFLSNDLKEKISKSLIGKMKKEKNPFYKQKHSNESKTLMSKALTYSINDYKEKYKIFPKEEEMRYNPDKPGEKEIQVHCKNHDCENSKEKGGWFTPSKYQLSDRIRALESKNGSDGAYFYCCDECKDECILYNLRSDPYKEKTEKPYTQEEYNIWRQVILKQDNYECQMCGSKKDLHCHHINPIKTHPHLALDPTNGIVLCRECHYKIGHKTGTECSTGNLANINQIGCKLGN